LQLQLNLASLQSTTFQSPSSGPSLDCPGWAQRVRPNLKTVVCICSGMFSTRTQRRFSTSMISKRLSSKLEISSNFLILRRR
ncbi:hypothetical protein PISMIDRAFT_160617, partial [Pisolithus microcarpus 441]